MAGLTSNRFTLGITGWLTDEMQLLGHDPKTRGKRFDEALQVIRGCGKTTCFHMKGVLQFSGCRCMPHARPLRHR